MIRLSGILIGSMLAVAILILLIGIPRFPVKENAAVTSPSVSAGVAPEAGFDTEDKSAGLVNTKLEPEHM